MTPLIGKTLVKQPMFYIYSKLITVVLLNKTNYKTVHFMPL